MQSYITSSFKDKTTLLLISFLVTNLFSPHKTHQLFLTLTILNQFPEFFCILPVLKEIISFVLSTLLLLFVKQLQFLLQKQSKLVHLNSSQLSSLALKYKVSSLSYSQSSNNIFLRKPLLKPSERLSSPIQMRMNWWKAQSVPPSHMWYRPFRQTLGLTKDWTATVVAHYISISTPRLL